MPHHRNHTAQLLRLLPAPVLARRRRHFDVSLAGATVRPHERGDGCGVGQGFAWSHVAQHELREKLGAVVEVSEFA